MERAWFEQTLRIVGIQPVTLPSDVASILRRSEAEHSSSRWFVVDELDDEPAEAA
jgi:hypothetical protein